MNSRQKTFLEGCFEVEGVEALIKTIQREGYSIPTELTEHYLAMLVVPHSLLAWVRGIAKQLDDGPREFNVPGHPDAVLLLNRVKSDVYTGYLHRSGEVLHRFVGLSIPQLAGHLMTVLEIYDDFDPAIAGDKRVVDNIVPLLERLLANKAQPINITINNSTGGGKSCPQDPFVPTLPVIGDTSCPKADGDCHDKAEVPATPTPTPTPPPKPTPPPRSKNPVLGGGQMNALANSPELQGQFGRSEDPKETEKDEDPADEDFKNKIKELKSRAKVNPDDKEQLGVHHSDYAAPGETLDDVAGRSYMGRMNRQPGSGASADSPKKEATRVLDQLRTTPKPDISKSGESVRAGYHMTLGNFYRLQKDEAQALRHHRELERQVQLLGGKYSKLDSEAFDVGTREALDDLKAVNFRYAAEEARAAEHEMPSDVSVAPEEVVPVLERPMAKQAVDLINIAVRSLKRRPNRTLLMTKSEMACRCPDCGEPEFVGEKFVGCVCLGYVKPSSVKVQKNSDGTYRLDFGRGWDIESYRLLLEVLKRGQIRG